MPAQHGSGDFGRIGQVSQTGLVHGQTGGGDPSDQFVTQPGGDIFSIGAQRHLRVGSFFAVVIGVVRGDIAQRRVHLDVHESLIVVDIEQGLGRILDTPDDIGRDLDGTAALVIHLQLVAGQVADAQGNLLAAVPGQDPAQPGLAVGAAVGPEQHDGHALVGLKRIQAADQQQADNRGDSAPDDAQGGVGILGHADRPGDEQRHPDQQHQDAVGGAGWPFGGSGVCVGHRCLPKSI